MGGEVCRYGVILVKFVVAESLGDHTQATKEKTKSNLGNAIIEIYFK